MFSNLDFLFGSLLNLAIDGFLLPPQDYPLDIAGIVPTAHDTCRPTEMFHFILKYKEK